MELVRRLIVGILGLIDAVVFDLISMIYNLLMDIASATLFSEDIFENFTERIYALLGLFMLFKVSFSLIQYIVNPDEFSDNTKGGKKMVMNILIVLVLIVITPTAFDISRDVQQTLLDEHVMEKLILGAGVNGQPIEQSKMGDVTKIAVFSAFYRPDDEACANAIFSDENTSVCHDIMGESATNLYVEAYKNGSVFNMIHEEDPNQGEPLFMIKKENNDKEYAINYMFIVSTVAGVVTALLFLNFCFDIAIRTVKLVFLELISPIPIISYIDPSSAKSGMFSKWLKEVGKTYADLFIRLGAVYFAITLIAALMDNPDLGTPNLLARVFIILGILIFAQQVPKLIGELLGVKIDGNFSLNPMSKINSSPLAGALVGGVTGLGLGTAANVAAAPQRLKDFKAAVDKDGFGSAISDGNGLTLKGLGSAARHVGNLFTPLAGGTSAMIRGGIAGSTGKGSALKAGVTGATTASRLRNARQGGYGFKDNVIDSWNDMAGLKKTTGTTSKIEDKMKANSMQIANYKRDEQSYSQQLADLARDNPQSYNQAFAATALRDENGDVMRDANGKLMTQRTYSDYNSYFSAIASDISQTDLETRAAHLMHEGKYADDASALRGAREEVARERGIITQAEYDAYQSVMDSRDKADDEARKLEKRNKELQGYIDAKSGKPKN